MNRGGVLSLRSMIGLLGLALASLSLVVNGGGGGSSLCGFPAIYNFGDSNSDTGTKSAALMQIPSPNGETFFGAPAGRYCDGRLILDFIVEELNLPYLSAYLDSLGVDFRHGANFAAAGAAIGLRGFSPFHLGIQVSQFVQFKSRAMRLYNQVSPKRKGFPFKSILPRPKDFSKALYTIDIGQNDLTYGFLHSTVEQVRDSIPVILNRFSHAVNILYKEGARFFWVHNTGPIGCLPFSIIYDKDRPNNLDKTGCMKPRNEVAHEFNRQLKDILSQLKERLPHAVFTYVDVYSAKYTLISNAKNQGFLDPVDFCCGSYVGYHVECGHEAVVNGTVYGKPCKNPSMHINWDGVHYTEAANSWVARHILNGSFSEPPVSIGEACQHPTKT